MILTPVAVLFENLKTISSSVVWHTENAAAPIKLRRH